MEFESRLVRWVCWLRSAALLIERIHIERLWSAARLERLWAGGSSQERPGRRFTHGSVVELFQRGRGTAET